jgi:hypothetical protein
VPDPYGVGVVNHHICRCNPDFRDHHRYDWVAVPDHEVIIKESTDYRIYQLQLIFKYRYKHGTEHCLAYVRHFRYTSLKKRDIETGMWVVEKTDDYEVVPVNLMMCKVHLVPFFETRSSVSGTGNENRDAYSFQRYLVNCYSDRYAFKYFS